MKKNMFKRAWLNITRKKSKSIIFLIVMFIMANLVLSSLSISKAVDESTTYAKEVLGSEVYLNADMESMKNDMSQMFQGGQMGMSQGDMSQMTMSRPQVYKSMVESIANSEYVRDYTYSITASATEVNFTLYETESSDMFGRNDRNGLQITGINSYAFIPEVENNTYEITEGTYFDESTNNQIIISYELALLNNLTVGSIIELQNQETLVNYQYEIIGIFTSTQSGSENHIYMNTDSVTNLLTSQQLTDTDYAVNNAVFYLNNPDDVENFIKEANELYDFESLSLVLDIDTTAYDQMAGPIEQVGSFADTILIIVVIAAVIILSLIINNNIKDRKYEMGVLMSLGAKKKNIIGQIFLELAIVATVGFILSIGTSSLIATQLSSNLLEEQLTMEEEISTNNFGRPSGGMGSMMNMGNTTNNNVEVIDEINVNISAEEYALLFTIGYLITFLSMTLPAYNIIKYEPKTILTRRD